MAVVPLASADMTRPAWSIGDFWEYHVQQVNPGATADGRIRDDVTGLETIQVEGIPYPSWRATTVLNLTIVTAFQIWVNMSGPSWFRVSDLALVKQDLAGTYDFGFGFPVPATATLEWNPPQDIQWPLTTAATWTTTGWMNTTTDFGGMPGWANYSRTTTFVVEPEQSVTVPAGTFTTTPLNGTDPSGWFNLTYWSPDAGNYVRLLSSDGSATQFQRADLTAFRYQVVADTQPPMITGVTTTPPSPVAGVDPVAITATVTDDGTVDSVYVNVTQPDGTSVNRTMNAITGNRWTYSQVWNQVGVHTFVIWATDATMKSASAPGSFATISPDTEAPEIVHTPPTGPFYPDTTIRIEAMVTDNNQVQEVHLFYGAPGTGDHNVTMTLTGGTYEYTIPATNTEGIVNYYISAVDASGNWNRTMGPSEGYYTLTIERRPEGLNVPLVAGGILAVVLIIAAIAAVVVVSRRRRREAPPSPPPPAPPPP